MYKQNACIESMFFLFFLGGGGGVGGGAFSEKLLVWKQVSRSNWLGFKTGSVCEKKKEKRENKLSLYEKGECVVIIK